MKRKFIFLMLAVLFAPLAMNAQRGIVQQKNVEFFSMPTISLSELDSKDGDRANNTLMTQNFDGMSSIPTSYSATGWFAYNAGNGNNWTLNTSSSNAYSGSKSAQYSTSSSAADCYLVSAPFTVSNNASSLSVSLYECTDQGWFSTTTQSLEVFFVKASDVTSAAAVASATHYDAMPTASYSNTTFAQQTGFCMSSALAGQSVRVVVHCNTTSTTALISRHLYVDDIVVTENTHDFDCGVVSLPHFNGFESVAEYGCWTMSGSDMTLSSSNVYAGSNCLRINGLDNDQWQYLISPEFEGDEAMEMSFYYRIANADRDQFFYLGWGPDLGHLSWGSIEIAANTSYQKYTEVFPRGTKYVVIAVYGRSSTSSEPSYMLIDNINFTGGCIRPRSLEASNVTTKTAGISWGDYADSYNVRYRTKTIVSATNNGAVFSDTFESGSLSSSRWLTQNQLYTSSSTDWDVRTYSNVPAYAGNYFASSRSYDGEYDRNVKNWLVTTQMNLGNVVKFYMRENYPSWLDHIEVLVSADDLTFVAVATPTVASAEWEEVTIDLTKYAGKSGYIAILHEDEGNDFIGIDNFGIYNYTYTYEYGPWQYTTADSNNVTLTGLTAETTYEVQVQSACGSDWSSAIDFTTPSGCTAPIDLTATNITPTTVTLSWSNYQDSYNVRYRGQVFYEGFDRGIPTDWTIIDADGDGYSWYQYRYGMDNTSCAASPSYVSGGTVLYPDDWLISPQLDLEGFFEVWVKGQDINDYEEYYTIYLSTTGNAISDFTSATVLASGITTNEFQRVTADLTSYAEQKGYIAIRHHNCSDQFWFCVDNFGIYKDDEWLTVSPDEATVDISDLLPNTEYVWQVSGDECDNWSAPAYFNTPEAYIKHIEAYTSNKGGYYLIASPIGTVAATDVENLLSNNYDFYYFDQAQVLEWINYDGDEELNYEGGFGFEPGKGYLYANSQTVDLIFTGAAYTGTGEVTLSKTTAATSLEFPDWNLVGNPFAKPAYLDCDYYVMNGDGTEVITPESTAEGIQAMEGCFVIAETDGDIVTFSTTAPTSKGSKVVLNLSNGNNVIDRAIVRFGQGRQLPKFQLNPDHTKVYMTVDGNDYAVVSTDKQDEMPVSFKAEKSGNYTLSFSSEEVSFNYIHLIDNMTGADIDLLATPSYSFEATPSDYACRFRLVFSTDSVAEDSFAYFSNGSLVVSNEGNATLQVVDVMGRIVRSESISGNANVNLNEAAGVYVIRLINGNNVKTQKIVVR
jgi:hypothetical protein